MLNQIKDRLRVDLSEFPKIKVYMKTKDGTEMYLCEINDENIKKEIIKELYKQYLEETQGKST